MTLATRLIASCVALAAFSAHAADITGNWRATVASAGAEKDYTYVFRQDGYKLIGTIKSPDGVTAIANGYINYKTISFTENVTAEGHREVFEYTGELVSDTEIKFKRQAAGTTNPAIQFVATRVGKP